MHWGANKQFGKSKARHVFYVAALLLLGAWLGLTWWFKQIGEVPLNFAGLWDGKEKPTLRGRLLGMQTPRSGASIEVEDGNPAFALGGERAVLLGRWTKPRSDSMGSWGAWVKLREPLAMGWLPFAGTGSVPANWGIGAIDGKPAAWMVTRGGKGEKELGRVISNAAFPVGEWVHMAVVLTPGRMTLWVNGRLAASGEYNAANPEDYDVWLGRVKKTIGMLHPPNPDYLGDPAPSLLLDDYIHYDHSLTEREVRALAWAGRGGIERAEARVETAANLQRSRIWVLAAAVALMLCGAAPKISWGVQQIWQREYLPVWLILITGGAITAATTIALARAARAADQEKLDLFADQLRQTGESAFERMADLLRRARDYLRAHPGVTLSELQAWANENGAVHDYTGIDGIGWAPLEQSGDKKELPVRAYTRMNREELDGWYWEESVEKLNGLVDVAATGLVQLRPTAAPEQRRKKGIRLYLAVHDRPLRRAEANRLLGVVFLGVDLVPMAKAYWRNLPPIIGARFIPGQRHSRDEIAVDTGELYPATKRPLNPYLEKEVDIRTYGRSVWVRLWTTESFRAHSGIYWPWLSGAAGSAFTFLAAATVAVQVIARLKQQGIVTELKESRDALRATQKERESLSRELHDGAIQSLYAVQLQLGRITPRIASEADWAAVHAGLSSVIGELREFTAGSDDREKMRPSLPQVLEAIAAQARHATPVGIHLDQEPEAASRLTQVQAVHFANIAREALSNAIRHAAAQNVWLELRTASNRELLLKIRDDGLGFDPSKRTSGNGLGNMRARAEELGAQFHVESAPGQGTAISITLDAELHETEQNDE